MRLEIKPLFYRLGAKENIMKIRHSKILYLLLIYLFITV